MVKATLGSRVPRQERESALLRALLLGCLTSMLLCTIEGAAAAQSLQTLSFEETLRRARENPPVVLAARASLERTRAELAYARAAYLPRVFVEASSGAAYDNRETTPNRIEVPPSVPASEREAYRRAARTPRSEATALDSQGRLSFDYALIDPARSAGVRAARDEVRAEQASVADTQRIAQTAAAELYVESLAAAALVEDAELTHARRGEQIAAIEALVKAGLRPPVDLTRARIELIAARRARETREIEHRAAQAALAASVGLPPGTIIHPEELDDAGWPASVGPAQASELAARERPELDRREAALSASRARDDAARRARLPSLGVLASANARHADILSGTGIEGLAYGGSGVGYLRWSALDPQIWRRARVTRAEIEQAARQLESELFAIRTAAIAAAYAVERARAELALVNEVLVAAEAARTAQSQRYRAGLASLLELLDSESLEQTARRQRIEAERDHRIARVRLLSECGVLEQLAR